MASTTLVLPDLNCACCADEIERRLKQTPHVAGVHLDFAAGVAHVEYHDGMTSPADLQRIVEAAGYECGSAAPAAGSATGPAPAAAMHVHHPAEPAPPTRPTHGHLSHRADMLPVTMGTRHDRMQYEMQAIPAALAEHRHQQAEAEAHTAHSGHGAMDHAMSDPRMANAMETDMRTRFVVALVLTIPVVLYSPLGMRLLGLRLPEPIPANWILFLLTTPIVLWGGWIFIAGAYHALRRGMLNMAVLIAVGVLAAYLFSVGLTVTVGGETFYEAAAMLVTFVLFGHWMEMRARRGTSDSLRALFALVPPTASVIREGGEVNIPTAEIVVGDVVVLRPGEKAAVDGEVIEGETAIDESLVTGESLPVPKRPGDPVVGGSINRTGAIRYRATKVGEETALAQIVKLVERAQTSKAPGQRLADRAARYLVVLAVGSGLATFLAWYLLAGQPLLLALTFAISAIVIACPDALGLATPTAVAVGVGLGARHNILIKDAATLERLSRIDAIVLDKTGTLTEGRPRVTEVVAVPPFSPDEILSLAAAAEERSGHPLASAVIEEVRRLGLAVPSDVSAFQLATGRGVRATVAGRELVVGTPRLLAESGIATAPLEGEVERLRSAGQTVMLVALDGQPAGVLGAEDPIKPNAQAAVDGLQAAGVEVAMVTGDNRGTATAVARRLGLERVEGEVLPEGKAAYVQRLQREGRFVAMVGDGINDAPALAQADIGIAIGAGTDVAIETAAVVLMRSDPIDVLAAIRLSKATVRKMKQNLFWASIYNVLAIPVAAGVLYPSLGIALPPEVSALLMSASSIIVATNAVLLKRAELELTAV